MLIGSRRISPTRDPYVIAEIGVNHDGEVARALELVDAAALAGADAVKVQVFTAAGLMGRDAALAAYQMNAGETDPTAMLARLELTLADLRAVVDRAHDRGLHAIATIFTTDLIEPAATIKFDAFKSASPDITHRPLLQGMWETGRPLIVSTGASTIAEIDRAIGWLQDDKVRHHRLALLHCVSAYPTPVDAAALRAVAALHERYSLPIGYSDHTAGTMTGGLAVAAGAAILEKHFTYDRTATGPDHAASLEPDQLREYIAFARQASRMMGAVGKRVLDIERDVRSVSRQSVVAARPIRTGVPLTREDLTIRRPGGGAEPWRLDEIVGMVCTRDIDAGQVIRETDITFMEAVR